ncbi:Hsp70 family protein [Rubinisphaera italica]|uniref:Chaperone protein HscC n=1 Tax=Rubinisphaera italica TaxID=2527969 RepID=A0A5C5X9X2_9PLAN|nr:molecular chaperone HscC [Rubinisphaera italica]TWT59584.1 Chaperone protein HscC [Rubinisphaera italica]
MILGIDLGTTNSLCAVFRNGQPELIPNSHGDLLTPSVVGLLESGELLVGEPAREQRVTRPQAVASRFKRLMGTKELLKLGSNKWNAEELSSFVLKTLKQDAEAYLGEEITEAVITVPAYFNDLQRRSTKIAGELAGLKVRRIINEPTAAALAYGFHDRDAEKHLLVIDLGGGTFDVTLMEVFEGTLEIIASAGESTLGGEDFTDRLAGSLLESQKLHLESAEIQHPQLVARLREECEQAKRKFGSASQVTIRIPDHEGNFSTEPESLTITSEDFTKIVTPLLDRIRRPIARVLRDAGRSAEQIDDVILVGGATRMPVLNQCVKEMFGKEPMCQHNPDEVVAIGAAIQAALIVNDAAVQDIVMTDVCPFTLGVEVVKQFAGRDVNGFYLPIIHRNTTLPISKEEVVSTVRANQRQTNVRVYQGEHRKVEDNIFLGELTVKDIPLGPAGTPICIRFTYDLNGLLEVEAFVPNSEKRFRTVLTNHAQHLSEAEVQSAVKKLENIKFYPRDEAQHQRLLQFSERVLGEIAPDERQQFEEIIDSYEQAMSSGDREFFFEVRSFLIARLNEIGFPYEEPSNENDSDDSN